MPDRLDQHLEAVHSGWSILRIDDLVRSRSLSDGEWAELGQRLTQPEFDAARAAHPDALTDLLAHANDVSLPELWLTSADALMRRGASPTQVWTEYLALFRGQPSTMEGWRRLARTGRRLRPPSGRRPESAMELLFWLAFSEPEILATLRRWPGHPSSLRYAWRALSPMIEAVAGDVHSESPVLSWTWPQLTCYLASPNLLGNPLQTAREDEDPLRQAPGTADAQLLAGWLGETAAPGPTPVESVVTSPSHLDEERRVVARDQAHAPAHLGNLSEARSHRESCCVLASLIPLRSGFVRREVLRHIAGASSPLSEVGPALLGLLWLRAGSAFSRPPWESWIGPVAHARMDIDGVLGAAVLLHRAGPLLLGVADAVDPMQAGEHTVTIDGSKVQIHVLATEPRLGAYRSTFVVGSAEISLLA